MSAASAISFFIHREGMDSEDQPADLGEGVGGIEERHLSRVALVEKEVVGVLHGLDKVGPVEDGGVAPVCRHADDGVLVVERPDLAHAGEDIAPVGEPIRVDGLNDAGVSPAADTAGAGMGDIGDKTAAQFLQRLLEFTEHGEFGRGAMLVHVGLVELRKIVTGPLEDIEVTAGGPCRAQGHGRREHGNSCSRGEGKRVAAGRAAGSGKHHGNSS